MDNQTLMERAAAVAADVVSGVKPDQFALPTPCAEWDVRALVNHITHWSAVVSERSARKLPPPTDGSESEATDYTADADWPASFTGRLDRAVQAWAEPGAWEGETVMASDPRQADFVGRMVIGELVLHIWDLAKATGQEFTVDPEVAAAAFEDACDLAEMAREWKAYGPEIEAPADAAVVDRLLAITGRDPAWRGQAF